MQKAEIEILDGEKKSKKIRVMFNPESYNLSYSASYSEKKIPGLDGAISQYISGENASLDMTLYFDTFTPATPTKAEGGTNVAKRVGALTALLFIDGSLHRPPTVKFHWGTLQFKGILTSVKENYTMFLSDGTPVRAKVDVTFKSLLDVSASKRKRPFESPDRTKVQVIHEGEQLWNYAWQEYGDAGRWREIAVANGIRNPLDVFPGMAICLPALRD